MEQVIISSIHNYRDFEAWIIESTHNNKVFIVHDDSLKYQKRFHNRLLEIGERNHISFVFFNDFTPNPLYDSVVDGVELFKKEGCDTIIAIGGGSAMDVAKCIKLYSQANSCGANGEFLRVEIVPNDIPFLAMPTTAGTGSEATRYAVIYYGGKKQSITSENCIPGTVLMDPTVLKTLPLYQKKATMCDALCHAIESFWSVNSTEASIEFSKAAIHGVLRNMNGYLENDDNANAEMLSAAHFAGKAINITQTTAGHAMCYKITSMFRVAHGHAAILCDRVLFPWMIDNVGKCVDPRGKGYLKSALDGIGKAMGCSDARKGAEKLASLFDFLNLEIPLAEKDQFDELIASVNPDRLKNHPIALDRDSIDALYHTILKEKVLLDES